MKKILFGALCFCFLSTAFAQNNNRPFKNRDGASFAVDQLNIVLGSPTDNSIQFSVYGKQNATLIIEYHPTGKKTIAKTSVYQLTADQPLDISLTDLSANTPYEYQVNYKFEKQSNYTLTATSFFSTQRSKSSTFSFAVQGDSHPERAGKMFNASLYQLTLDSVSRKKPDFYFMMGDDFSLDRLMNNQDLSKQSVDNVYLTQRYFLGNTGKNPPLFLVNGNHEQAAKYLLDSTTNNAAVLAGNARKKYFPLPAPGGIYTGDTDPVAGVGLLKDYYAFEWGNALFVVIDPYWHSDIPVDNQPSSNEIKSRKQPWDITLGNTQYQWLKTTLENSKAKYKFVFAHHVSGTGRGGIENARFFEWGGYSRNNNYDFTKYRPGWELPIHQLMAKNKVTIFFQGHDHIYAKQELDGVIYQSVPNPADDTYTAFNKEAYRSGVVLSNSGFLHITVTASQVMVEYVRIHLPDNDPNNRENYSYIIK